MAGMTSPVKALLVLLAWLLAGVASALADGEGRLHESRLAAPAHPGIELLRPPGAGERFEYIPIYPVHFAHDEDTLSERARATLDDAALLIRHLPGVTRVIVRGYADIVASEAYNDSLSDRRAAAVRDHLLARGIPEALLQVIGYGKSRPADEEWTREGRARNRRAEITIIRMQPGG